jgi:hypothetical protein
MTVTLLENGVLFWEKDITNWFGIYEVNVKAISSQALTGLKGSRSLRHPDF